MHSDCVPPNARMNGRTQQSVLALYGSRDRSILQLDDSETGAIAFVLDDDLSTALEAEFQAGVGFGRSHCVLNKP